MKKTTKILSASLIVAFATPMFALADFERNWEKRWTFDRTEMMAEMEERKAKFHSLIENASDEVKEIHEKRKAWEEISDDEKEVMKKFAEENWMKMKKDWKKFDRKWWKNIEWKEAAWKFFEKSKKERREKITVEERIEKVDSDEDLTDEEKAEKISKIKEREKKMAEKKAERVETLEKIQESVEKNSSLSDEKKSEILEKISSILSKFFN